MENIQHKVYPEFGNLTGEEISIRLEALDNLLNAELNTEFIKAGLEKEQSIFLEPTPEVSDEIPPGLDLKSRPNFLVIAHRGWSGSYPENTLIGMREAIKLGCHMIEFDVALTADRRMIIIHDDTLSRTTSGIGPVKDLTFRELRALDAGSWFHPRYTGAKLPALDEILLISRGSGIQVNIEIKNACWEDELQEDGIERRLIAAIRRYKVRDRVVISSFRWGFIERIHALDPEIRTALLHYKDLGRLNPAELKKKYGVVAFNPHCIDLTQKFVDQAHEAGLLVLPFTINSYQDMEKYYDMGVDGMFTNHPNRLFRFIEEHNLRINKFRKQDLVEDREDVDEAIKRLELEELEKARKRTRWRSKRRILEAEKNAQGDQSKE